MHFQFIFDAIKELAASKNPFNISTEKLTIVLTG